MTIYSNSFNYSASIKVAQMFNRGGPVFLSCVLLRFVGYMKKTMHAIDGGSLMKILRYIKRRIILAGLMVMLTMSPLYATMPVVDFTSIINAITQFTTTVQYYQSMISTAKGEYERVKAAVETISEGGFENWMTGCMMIANQAAGWSTTGENMDQLLTDLANGFGTVANAKNQFNKAVGLVGNTGNELWNTITGAWDSLESGNWDAAFTGTLDSLVGLGDLTIDSTAFVKQFAKDVQMSTQLISDATFIKEGYIADMRDKQIPALEKEVENLEKEKQKLMMEKQKAGSKSENTKGQSYADLIEQYDNAIEYTKAEIEKLKAAANSYEKEMLDDFENTWFQKMEDAFSTVEDYAKSQLHKSAEIYRNGVFNSILISAGEPLFSQEYKDNIEILLADGSTFIYNPASGKIEDTTKVTQGIKQNNPTVSKPNSSNANIKETKSLGGADL